MLQPPQSVYRKALFVHADIVIMGWLIERRDDREGEKGGEVTLTR